MSEDTNETCNKLIDFENTLHVKVINWSISPLAGHNMEVIPYTLR